MTKPIRCSKTALASREINPIKIVFFLFAATLGRPRGGPGAPFFNFKTAHDTTTKITEGNVIIIYNIKAQLDLCNDVN